MDIHLTSELADGIEAALGDLSKDASLEYCALISACGTIVADVGRVPGTGGEAAVAALATGALFATQKLASILGQDEDEGLLKEDAKRPLYLHPLGADYLLLSLGSETAEAGLVRIASRRFVRRLQGFAKELCIATEMEPEPPQQPVVVNVPTRVAERDLSLIFDDEASSQERPESKIAAAFRTDSTTSRIPDGWPAPQAEVLRRPQKSATETNDGPSFSSVFSTALLGDS